MRVLSAVAIRCDVQHARALLRTWLPLPESELCPVVMIVVDQICEQPFQTELVHRNDVTQ
jgi:hypothetical protein